MGRKLKDYGFSALRCEGGILPPEFLQTVSQLDARWQANTDYGLTRSLNLRDEIGRYWRVANDLWADYRERRERTDLNSERVGVENWLLALLEQVLGYHGFERCGNLALGERRFPIGYRSAGAAVPLVLTTQGYDLDRADPRFGEEGRRRPPHGLLQEYLNAEDACLWGVVSNGLVIRLLRDNVSLTRPAYLEVDLERLFEEQLFADFAAFWLLFHATRIAPRDPSPASCILEAWRNQSHETGERALAHLRDGVTDALRLLGNGFIEHPANDVLRAALRDGDLTAPDYFQELLRLVYRFLFLFTAEDRALLFAPDMPAAARALYEDGYALARLRERALKRRHYDAYGDLWEGLQITFKGLAEGAPPLGLPALGGLFAADQCPRLDGSQIDNARLLAAVRSLAFFQTGETLARVNYRDMGTEELGSVYESLLELQPQVAVAPWRFAFLGDAGGEAKGTARKLTGSYYTPSSLVAELIKSALAPVIERTLRENPTNPREALLKLRVIDPACGSGHFLLAAARRLAAEIARLDAGPDTPGETLRQHALREVVQHGIYGVDRNPLAVELCRTALWMETVEPGKPLTFLDAHIRCGDSLVGVLDPEVMDEGIPDEAYKDLTGDDKKLCGALKKRNKQGKGGGVQGSLFDQQSLQAATVTAVDLDAMPEETLADIVAKRQAWEQVEQDAAHRQAQLRANLFTGAFFAVKTAANENRVPVTEDLNRIAKGLAPRAELEAAVDALAAEHQFFHWHLAFPEVFNRGGFDVVLGNPPWEVSQLSEQEFFATVDPEISTLAGAKRKAAIENLKTERPWLWKQYLSAKRNHDAFNAFCRLSNRFPLTAFGKLNLYSLFAESFFCLKAPQGRAGIIVPTGIATDDGNKAFFAEIAGEKQLFSLFDFENREKVFPAVDSRMKFSLLTLGGGSLATRFAFFATRTEHMKDKLLRQFTLSAEDIELINPNTCTCPVFRSSADAELTKKIYRQVPVLIDESKGDKGNPWQITFRQGLFNMTSDSGYFRAADELSAEGARRDGANWIGAGGEVWVSLYEAKMIHQYDHRWASYEADGATSRDVTAAERADGEFHVMPRYWVPQKEVEARLASKGWKRRWLMGWRDICRSTDERTVIAGVVPRVGIGNNLPLLFTESDIEPSRDVALVANLPALTFDFFARHKVGGTHLNFFIAKQLPVLPPSAYTPADLEFIVPRVLKLVYTAHDMKPFAEDLGYAGPPFPFDPDRRALLRSELDACYARLYGLTRDELRYILDPADVYGEDFPSETFRVLKKNEMKAFGEYRTRRLVLEAWDQLQEEHLSIAMGRTV